MVPVNYNESTNEWEECSKENWDWDYKIQTGSTANGGTAKWANAKTADGSLWVWIPRFAYKIESGYHSSTKGTIDIVFLVGLTDKDEQGNTYASTYDMNAATTNKKMDNFVIHPAFNDNPSLGGWNQKIAGFWVSKFEAGYAGTANNASTAVDSQVKYTVQGTNYYGSVTANQTYMKYPAFKPNISSYVNVCAGDAFGLAKNLNGPDNPYGFTSTSKTHMMKNSEWGAVAYLTQSKYGRNNTEISINNYSSYKTGYSSGTNTTATGTSSNQNSYNTNLGKLASTTGSVHGIYDLSGGSNEFVAAITKGLTNANTYYTSCGSYLYAETDNTYVNLMSIDSNYASSSSGQTNNYNTHNNIFGDAVWETSASVSQASWYNDCSYYPFYYYAYLGRGGNATGGAVDGIFFFDANRGRAAGTDGFRACVW